MAALRQSSTMGISDMMRSSDRTSPARHRVTPPRAGPGPAEVAVVPSGARYGLRLDPPLAVVDVDAPGARTTPVGPDHEGAVGVAAEEAAPGVGGGARV